MKNETYLNDLLLKSRLNWAVISLLSAWALGCFILSYYYGFSDWVHVDIAGKVLWSFFAFIGLATAYVTASINTVVIYDDKVVLISLLARISRTIYFSNIDDLSLQDGRSDYHSYTEFIIYSGGKTYKFSSTVYRNFDEMVALFTSKIKHSR